MDEAWFFGEGEERREPRERRRAEPTRLGRIFRQVKAACTPSRFGFLSCSIAGFWLVCAAVVFYNYTHLHNPNPRFSFGNWAVVVYFTCLFTGRFSKGERWVLLAAGGVGILAIGHSLFLFWHLTNAWPEVVGEYWRFVLVVIAGACAAALPKVLAFIESKTFWQRLVGRPDLATLMFVPVMAVIATCWLLAFNSVQLFSLPKVGIGGVISDFLVIFVFLVVPLGIAMRAKSRWWAAALTQFSLAVLAFVYAFDFSYFGWAVIDLSVWLVADLVMVFLPVYVASRQVTAATTRMSRIFRPLWGVLVAVAFGPILLLSFFDFIVLVESSKSGSPRDWFTKGSYKKAYLTRSLHWGGYFKSGSANLPQIVIPADAKSDYLSKLRLGEAGLLGLHLVGLRPEIEVNKLKTKSPWIRLGAGENSQHTTRATSNQLYALINDTLGTQIIGSTTVEQRTIAESIQFRHLAIQSLEAGQVAAVLNIAENWNCLPDTGARWQARNGILIDRCDLNDSDWERLSEVSKTVKNVRVEKRSPFPTQFRAPTDAQLIISVDERTFVEEAKGLVRFSIGTQIGLEFPPVVDEVQNPVAMFDQVWATYGLKYNGRGLERLMVPEKVFTKNELTDQNFLYDDASRLFVPVASYLKWIDPALLPELKSLSTDAYWLGLSSERTDRFRKSLEKTDRPVDFMWAAPAGSYTFSKLESLYLSQKSIFSNFKFLQAMPNLQSLQIGNETLENNVAVMSLVMEIGKLKKLESLTIVGDSPVVDIKPFLQLLSQLKHLKTIRVVVPTDYPLPPEAYETAVQQKIRIEIIHTDDPEFDIPAHFGEHRQQVIERLRKKYGIED